MKTETSTEKLLLKFVGVKPNLFSVAETYRYNERHKADDNLVTSGYNRKRVNGT